VRRFEEEDRGGVAVSLEDKLWCSRCAVGAHLTVGDEHVPPFTADRSGQVSYFHQFYFKTPYLLCVTEAAWKGVTGASSTSTSLRLHSRIGE
jgi:hypothetical protein